MGKTPRPCPSGWHEQSHPCASPGLGKVAVLAPHYPPAFMGGGPIRTLHAMVLNCKTPSQVYILTSNRDHGSSKELTNLPGVWQIRDNAHVNYMRDERILGYLRGLNQLRQASPDILYLNSVLNFRFSIIPRLLSLAGFWGRDTRVVIAPRGELADGALAIRASKKCSFLRIARAVGYFKRVTWHASSATERQEILERADPDGDVLVRENETVLPTEPLTRPVRSLEPLRLVFVSRISRKKGLHLLIDALNGAGIRARLDIYGPASDSDRAYLRECQHLATASPSDTHITFHGPIPSQEVRRVFAQSDAFFFPTAGENFGHVIAEALSASCPVVTCDVTPWSHVLTRGGGVVLPNSSVDTWRDTLALFGAMDARELHERGAAAATAYREWRETTTRGSLLDLLMDPAALDGAALPFPMEGAK